LEDRSAPLPQEIACIDVGANGSVAVGLWTTHVVAIFSLPTLSHMSTTELATPFLIRSVKLARLGGFSQLFVGLGDGTLVEYAVNESTGTPNSSTRRNIALGTRPIGMSAFTSVEGDECVLVTSDRPTVITHSATSGKTGRLTYAGVNGAYGVHAHAAFNPQGALARSLVLVSGDGLRIGRVDSAEKLHVRTLSLDGEQPRRIAHSPSLGAYAVACVREEVDRVTGEETRTGSLKFLDDATFEGISPLHSLISVGGPV
jgi:DNA damage-binding protein 1